MRRAAAGVASIVALAGLAAWVALGQDAPRQDAEAAAPQGEAPVDRAHPTDPLVLHPLPAAPNTQVAPAAVEGRREAATASRTAWVRGEAPLTVNVLNVDGSPWMSADALLILHLSRDGHSGTRVENVRRGTATFRDVPLSCDLALTFKSIEGDSPEPTPIRKPRKEGVTTVIEYRPLTSVASITGRLLDGDGRPVVKEMVMATWVAVGQPSPKTKNAWVRTDEHGRFQSAVKVGWWQGWDRYLYLRRVLGQHTEEHLLDLSQVLETRQHDLGDIPLGDAPVVLAGVVEDTRGRPVRGARVSAFSSGDLMRALDQEGRLLASTDSAGGFLFRAWFGKEARSVPLKVTHDHYARPPDIELPIGTVGHVITLETSGTIAGQIRTGEGFDAAELIVTVRNEEGEAFARTKVNEPFAIRHLQPGTYDVDVRVVGWPETLAMLEGVETQAFDSPPDSRLDPLDLRGKIQRIRVNVDSASGAFWTPVEVLARPSGSTQSFARVEGRNMRIVTSSEERLVMGDIVRRQTFVLFHGSPSVELRVQAEGFEVQTLRGVTSDRDIVLTPRDGW